MDRKRLPKVVMLVSVLAAALAAGSVSAQDYPNKPIKIVVGFPPGGGTDVATRVIGAEMAKSFGQSIVVENRPGVAGTLGAAEVARSLPDGYTLLVTPGGHAIFGAIFKALPFNTVTSFDWISTIMTIPFFVMVPADSEFKNLADLIGKAKASSGTVSFGSAGVGTTHHLGLELLANRTGVQFLHIPYRGDAAVITGLLGHQVQFGLATPTQAIANVKGGQLRVLATTANVRAAELPDVPTVKEALGVDYDVRSWFALAGPAGMPKAVVERLNTELRKAVAAPDVHGRLAALGGEPVTTTPQAMHDRVARELQMWAHAVAAAGIPKQ